MSSKWQIAALGVVIIQGASSQAMENKAPNSPRNPLACSAEVRKEAGVVEALKRSVERKNSGDLSKKNSGDLSKEAKIVLSNAYYSYPGSNPEYYWHPRSTIEDRKKPWVPDYFPGQ